MQVALEKEFRAKEELIDENRQLRAELDAKAHKLADLHAQIMQLERDSTSYQTEIRELNTRLATSTSALNHHQVASTPISVVPPPVITNTSSSSGGGGDTDHVVGSLSLVVSSRSSLYYLTSLK